MGPSSASRPSPRGLGPPITPQSSNYTIMNLELLVVLLDEPALVIPGHLNFGPRRMFPKMFLAKLRIQKLFLQLKKETKVAPPEDPEVVPPTQEEGDQSCSFRGSRSCSSSSQRRAKDLILTEKSCVLKSLWTREDPLTRSKRGSRSKMKDPGQEQHKIPVQNPRRIGSPSQHISR